MPRKNIVVGAAKFRPVPKSPNTWQCGDTTLSYDRLDGSWAAYTCLGSNAYGWQQAAWGEGASPEEAIKDLCHILALRHQDATAQVVAWGEVLERAAAALALFNPKEASNE